MLRGATEESAGKFAAAVRKAVDGILEKGIPEELLMASLNSTELRPPAAASALKKMGIRVATISTCLLYTSRCV